MNESFLETLFAWQAIGQRLVEIKVDSLHRASEIRVMCYDYENHNCFWPTSSEDLTDAAIAAQAIAKIKASIARQLQDLEAMEVIGADCKETADSKED